MTPIADEMEERIADDGAGGGGARPPERSHNPQHLPRRPISYSQPLGRDPLDLSHSAKRNALRKHSLDEDRIHSAADLASSPFFAGAGAGVDTSRSYSYPHYVSSPPHSSSSTSSSSSSSYFANPNLPPPFPPQPQAFSSQSGGGGGGGGGSPRSELSETAGAHHGALPEFLGRGGGTGIFKVPLRAAALPNRPPPLELRPHPYRETQVGSFLRNIACTRSQLWAGQESGVRIWNLPDVFKAWGEETEGGFPFIHNPKLGDEESAPFQESSFTPPVLCIVVDMAHKLVWSGHKDGKIRSWQMEPSSAVQVRPSDRSAVAGIDSITTTRKVAEGVSQLKEWLSWYAHRAPVLSLVITPHGELWSGSEGGAIRVWPWEAIEKSLSLPKEERHVASLLVERSYVDLRSLVNVGGVSVLPASDVKYLIADKARSKVWSGSSLTFALWDSRTKELLKVFSIDGQVESQADALSFQDPNVEDEVKIKSSSKKEKSQGSMGFFQRSRNALFGAADAVRRAAVKGTFVEESRRAEALVFSMDGMIWMGCTSGLLIQWDGNGNRVQEVQHHSSSVKCLCAYGRRLWIGYLNGSIQVMDLKGNLIGGWIAHGSSVIKMAVGGSYIFTLANQGGIRGWNLTSPGPLDGILRSELIRKSDLYTKQENFKILAGTWNVGQERASHDALLSWLGSAASNVHVVVIGLQEIEMGAGFLAMSAAKETVGIEGSANGKWWIDAIAKTLDEGISFERLGSRQLAGLLIGLWARKNIMPHIGDVDAAAVPCGLGRAIGNKGAVGLRIRIYGRVMCFVNCHLAAHLEAVNKRNADFDHIYRNMTFSRPSNFHSATAVQAHRGANAIGIQYDDGRPELAEADMVIFLGDFNYRLHSITYDEARDLVSQRMFDWLRAKDQLRAEMKAGKVFQGMREGNIKFPPTYKFERHQAGLGGYDAGEKKRIPAWCDRILYRDSRNKSLFECSLECPVVASILEYDACLDVTGSDHKPVRCIFNVEMAHVDELTKRQQLGDIITSNDQVISMLEELCYIPDTEVSTDEITLQSDDQPIFALTNKCETERAVFEIVCDGQFTIKEDKQAAEPQLRPRSSFGLPHWLKVTPAAGTVSPGQMVEVSVHHDDSHTIEEYEDGIPQKWWCEDTRDKGAVLTVIFTSNSSGETRRHRLHVHHCCSTKSSGVESRAIRKVLPNRVIRQDPSSCNSSQAAADFCELRRP